MNARSLDPRERGRVVSPSVSLDRASTRAAPATTVADAYVRNKRKVRRSAALLEAIRQVDVAGDQAARQELTRWLESEYAARGGGTLLGLLATCYLGHPFVDHRTDFAGQIIEHYTPSDTLPDGFAVARTLAQSPHYLYIEIYADGHVVPIRPDGTSAD